MIGSCPYNCGDPKCKVRDTPIKKPKQAKIVKELKKYGLK